jgi:hypothetical protein
LGRKPLLSAVCSVWGPDGWALTGAGAAMIERVLYHDVDGPDELPRTAPARVVLASAVASAASARKRLVKPRTKRFRGNALFATCCREMQA